LKDGSSDFYNVGTGKETNVNELFDMLNDLIGMGQVEKHGPAMPGEQLRSVITSEKLMQKLGWSPSISVKEGLKTTVEYFNGNI
jgi:UDP-glucose 4-epimerase